MTSSPGVGLANWPTLITAGDRSSAFSLDSRHEDEAIHIGMS